MEALANCDELDVFDIDSVRDVIDYKWEVFALKVHYRGFLIHLTYVLSQLVYINNVILSDSDYNQSGSNERTYPDNFRNYLYITSLCLVYPLMYDGNQMMLQMGEYFDDPWNYLDITHISMGYFNVFR